MATISGGEKLEAALKAMAEKISNPGTLRVGFLEGSTDSSGVSNAMKAAINDFGAPSAGIPPRPFFRNMVAEKNGGWAGDIGKLLKAQDYDATVVLNFMGDKIKGQLQQAIQDFAGVPLKPATIKRKGFDKQLIDTGAMWQSVAWVVK